MIWEDSEKLIRDINLRRGLNIIWSPDPGIATATVGRGDGSGHGAGKTLFCRLLRYCLGEDTFANDDLRRSIAEQLPNGLVGVEVMIDSQLWSAIRPIGTTRRQIVRCDTTLDELVTSEDPSTGIQPMLDTLSALVTPEEGQLFIPSTRAHADWLFALAWLTRDQECRYDHILDWRHARADTRSAVLPTSVDQRVSTVRSLLGVLDQEELALKDQREDLGRQRRSLEQDQTFYRRSVEQFRASVAASLGTPHDIGSGGELELGAWRTEAASRLESEDTIDLSAMRSRLSTVRHERDVTLSEVAVIDGLIRQSNGRLELHQEQLRVLAGERSNLVASEIRAKLGPVCPVCNDPIDRALAEGCRLSHVLPDAATLAQDRKTLADQTRDQNAIVESFRSDIAALRLEAASLRHNLSELDEQISMLEVDIDAASRKSGQQWTEKRRVFERVSELGKAYDSLAQTNQAQAELDAKEESIKNRQTALRTSHNAVLQRFNELFGYVCRGVLGSDVPATVSLSGSGIQADVEVGGAAMESLKVIAFDLAAMLMSIEGRTAIPAFLMHDSPREADLGESFYYKWFKLIASIEAVAGAPAFQYVITTTSEPPSELIQWPFLIAELQGGDPSGRLLRRDV